MSLFSRTADLPGLQGTLRDCTAGGKGLSRLRAGDIAVINSADISRRDAQLLIDARPAAVVNMSRFSTGAVPNFGPHMLLDADVLLVEDTGVDLAAGLRDGKKGRITEDGVIHLGERQIGAGQVVTQGAAESTFTEAQQSLVDHMEAFFGNTIEFIHSEGPLLIDGLGIPDTGADISAGRRWWSARPDHRNEVKLRATSSASTTRSSSVSTPPRTRCWSWATSRTSSSVTPAGIGADTLRSGGRVILPADPDGHAAGLERIQDLGVGAMTFPAATDSATDLALLLADYHGAQLIVNAGSPFDLDAVFANDPAATPAALLTRSKLGARLVDASAISDLYTVNSGRGTAWLWAILGLLVAVAAIVLIVGLSGPGSFGDNLIDTWNSIALTFQGWFQ